MQRSAASRRLQARSKWKAIFTKQRVTITSALPYVNGVKHLGNLIGSLLPADIFHRFMDLFGIENIYVCGTDEHGAQTEISAMAEKLSPRDYSDKYHEVQKEIYAKWGFDFTFFGRTSSAANHKMTQLFFESISKNGFVTKGEITLPYCKHDKKFLADRYIEGICPHCSYRSARGDQCESCGHLLDPSDLISPLCMICKRSEIEFRKEKHLFLDLSKLSPELQKWILKNKTWPQNTRAVALSWLKEGLKPRCITRNLSWGVKVPLKGYTDLVFYVWFDAPIAYISMTSEARKDWKKWWSDSEIYHFLGKDNIPFHTIFWPGMLMAAKSKSSDYSLPSYVQGYEFLNWEGKKFSTSRGIGVFSDEALDLFPADYWRYYLSSVLPEKKDSNFEWSDFQAAINNELLANWGNLFYRVTSFIDKHFGKVPRIGKPGKPEADLLAEWEKACERVEKSVKKVKLRDALAEVMAFSDYVNRYFQIKEPWFAIRNKVTKKDAGTTCFYALQALVAITAMLRPYIPTVTERAFKTLRLKPEAIKWESIKSFKAPSIKSGAKVRSLILIQKLEDTEIQEAKSKVNRRHSHGPATADLAKKSI